MIGWAVLTGTGFGVLLLALGDLVPRAFTSDPAVIAQAREVWWIFALMMPANGAVLARDRGGGIQGVGAGLAGLIAVRLLTGGARFASSRWALTGAPAA